MRYLPSMWIGQLSGRQGSTVATHSRYTSFFRNRIMPVNPRSPAQTLVRDLMTSFAQNWKNIGTDQHRAWKQIADLVPVSNPQGVKVILSPSTFYTKFNLQRATVGLARLDTAPPVVEVPPSFTALAIDTTVFGAVMTITPTIVDGAAGNFIAVYATPVLGPGQLFVDQSKYRLITSLAGDVATPADVSTAYEAVFGDGWAQMAAMVIGFKILGVSAAGFLGDSVEGTSVIA